MQQAVGAEGVPPGQGFDVCPHGGISYTLAKRNEVPPTAIAQEDRSMIAAEDPPSQFVIEGVPRVGYDVRLCPFPGSLCSCMEFLKDPCDYDYVMAVTGAAFRRFWNRDDGGNIDLMYLAPQTYKRIFKALGYGHHMVSNSDKARLIHAIQQSVSRNVPVLAFGIIGPPECGIVTGYDKDGEILLGYSYFQDPSIKGYYEKADWYGDSHGIVVIGGRRAKPSERETFVSTIEWAIDVERTPERPEAPDHVCGLAACDAWADAVEVDADYPANDLKVLSTRLMVHGDQCVMLMERSSAAKYLRDMAHLGPEASDDLKAAADLYDAVSAECGKAWPWKSCDYNDQEVQKGLADPATRRDIARHIRIATDRETQAVEHLGHALAALKAATPR